MAERKFEDLGLGSKSASEARILNPDGSFNIRKKNVPWSDKINIYHELISMSWPRFFLVILFGFLIVNLLFASIYMMIGVENLTGIEPKSFGHDFMEEFFFSTQT